MNIARSRVLLHAARRAWVVNARGVHLKQAQQRLELYSSRKALSTAAGEGQKKKHEEDLFSRHGGKIVLGVIAGILGVLWRWIKGKGDATRIEGLVQAALALEPNEINELRLANDLSSSEYKTLVTQLLAQFPSGTATYPDFIAAVKQSLGGKAISNAHLLDRLVLADPRRGFENPISDGESPQYALDYLLVALNLCIDEPAIFRVDTLWHLLRSAEQLQQTGSATLAADGQFSQPEATEQDDHTEDDGNSEQHSPQPAQGVEDVSADSVVRVVDLLVRTCQLPGEKLVVEEKGNVIPYQKHYKGTADELLSKAKKELKFPAAEQRISADRFHALLVSNSLCAWGECYREKK